LTSLWYSHIYLNFSIPWTKPLSHGDYWPPIIGISIWESELSKGQQVSRAGARGVLHYCYQQVQRSWVWMKTHGKKSKFSHSKFCQKHSDFSSLYIWLRKSQYKIKLYVLNLAQGFDRGVGNTFFSALHLSSILVLQKHLLKKYSHGCCRRH